MEPRREGQEEIGPTRNKGSVEKATAVIQPQDDQGQSPGEAVEMGRRLPSTLLQAQK